MLPLAKVIVVNAPDVLAPFRIVRLAGVGPPLPPVRVIVTVIVAPVLTNGAPYWSMSWTEAPEEATVAAGHRGR